MGICLNFFILVNQALIIKITAMIQMKSILPDKQSKLRKFFSWIFQLIVFVSIFSIVSAWQQKDMLDNGQSPVSKISLLSVDGIAKHYNLNDKQNNTFIYFFAPWCRVCHASIDNLEEIYQTKPEATRIIVIALDWLSLNQINEFLSQHNLTMPVLIGTEQLQKEFKITAFPSYYLISKEGEIKSKGLGYTSEVGMRWRINAN